ncbi:C40 family peptidase [Acetivibrio clariflavus]|uniref:Cell wall-associated hydrolase, invasion-associated protein n=1 Tax=Acetivibrio clariflavus (strain DSM 19732 / NBRC 101661 / EBR45) TaxID=720554 RepID=G8M2P9_ACECE|nr:NlpC/P60 family protein [Acetivibrio clariflavus]AEV67123.1 cell wall-associated hydrolase, invasion-associated protein [Acetivibrio clariflavus DSM 19732]HOQ01054.1 NlpC/P60 family protein [Acetivibrio clariflavus]HPU41381.1 NlpC/P60 family protein [Acetivibrio clariflavus]
MKKKIAVFMVTVFISVFISALAFVNTTYADYHTERILLKQGMRTSEVYNLQDDLRALGYLNVNPTGYFGNLTYQAVKNYQKDKNVAVDGIVGPVTSRLIKEDLIVQKAKSYMEVPYVWGGTSPSGFDCSGFTHYVMLKNNITIPRTSSTQYNSGYWVSKSQLKKGDLVFFTTYKSGPSHVGIYIGNNQFIHASSGAGKVTISNLNSTYYAQRYIGAKRVI